MNHYVIKIVLATGRRFSPCTPVFSTNKTYHHDISDIWLKMALSAITQYIHNLSVVICNIDLITVNSIKIQMYMMGTVNISYFTFL